MNRKYSLINYWHLEIWGRTLNWGQVDKQLRDPKTSGCSYCHLRAAHSAMLLSFLPCPSSLSHSTRSLPSWPSREMMWTKWKMYWGRWATPTPTAIPRLDTAPSMSRLTQRKAQSRLSILRYSVSPYQCGFVTRGVDRLVHFCRRCRDLAYYVSELSITNTCHGLPWHGLCLSGDLVTMYVLKCIQAASRSQPAIVVLTGCCC